jgi:hypothetical protein
MSQVSHLSVPPENSVEDVDEASSNLLASRP